MKLIPSSAGALFFWGSSDQSCVVYGGVSGDVWCIVCVAPFKNGRATRGFIYEHVNGRRLRLREQRDSDERDSEKVSQSSPLQRGAHFQPLLSINFMLPVFEKHYKYAEQPEDKIPIPGIAR